MSEKYATLEKAAEILGTTPKALRQARHRGKFRVRGYRSLRYGLLFRLEDVIGWMESHGERL
jgi:hypothetical protein